jgi:nuclear pore complex protein Nup98-Nup96
LIIQSKSLDKSLTKTLNISATTSNITQAPPLSKSGAERQKLNTMFDPAESFNNQTPLNPIENNETLGGRRTSWLQTNALVKARQSVNRPNESILENTLEKLVTGKDVEAVTTPQTPPHSANTSKNTTVDKTLSDSLFLSRSQHDDTLPEPSLGEDYPPHPTGIVLRRPGYYVIPSLAELISLVDEDGRCVVDNFTIGRRGYGSVYFNEPFDVTGLNLDELVHFRHKEVTIYPDDENKPPVGSGLNRKAQITLDKVWPHDKTLHEPIKDEARLAAMDFEGYLRRVCDKHDTRFLEYRADTGSWVFKVDHFSKYGLSDSDDEENLAATDPKKAKLVSVQPAERLGAIPKVVTKSAVDKLYNGNNSPLYQISDSNGPRLDGKFDQRNRINLRHSFIRLIYG